MECNDWHTLWIAPCTVSKLTSVFKGNRLSLDGDWCLLRH
jgi:hypothetical protein